MRLVGESGWEGSRAGLLVAGVSALSGAVFLWMMLTCVIPLHKDTHTKDPYISACFGVPLPMHKVHYGLIQVIPLLGINLCLLSPPQTGGDVALAAAERKAPLTPDEKSLLPFSGYVDTDGVTATQFGFTPEQAAASASAAAAGALNVVEAKDAATAAAVIQTIAEQRCGDVVGPAVATLAVLPPPYSPETAAAAAAAAASAVARTEVTSAASGTRTPAAEPAWSSSRGVHLLVCVHGHRGSWTAFFPLVETVVLAGSWGGGKLYRHSVYPPPLPFEAQPQTQSPIRWHSFSLDFNEEASALHPALVDQQAEFLLLAVQHLLDSYRAAGQKIVHVALVAHSLGGMSLMRAVSLQQHPRRGVSQVDLRDASLVSLFFLNSPVGGHQLLQQVPSFAWMYRQLHADFGRVLGATRSSASEQLQKLQQQAMLLPRTVGVYTVSSGFQDMLVHDSVAGFPPETPELSPSFLWATVTLKLSRLRLLAIKQHYRQGLKSGKDDKDALLCMGLSRAARCGLLTQHVFYKHVSLPLTTGAHASSCHECPLMSHSTLRMIVQLLQAQASLAEQLMPTVPLINSFLSRSYSEEQQQLLLQLQIEALEAASAAGTMVSRFLRLRVSPILDSGLQALHPSWRLREQQDSLSLILAAVETERRRRLLSNVSEAEDHLYGSEVPPAGYTVLARLGLCGSCRESETCVPQMDALTILFTAHEKGLLQGIKATSAALVGADGYTSVLEEDLCWAAAAGLLQQPMRSRSALPLLQHHLLRVKYGLAGDEETPEEREADEREKAGLLLQPTSSLTRAKLLGMLPVSPERLLPLPVDTQRLLHAALLGASRSVGNSGSREDTGGFLEKALREGRSTSHGPFLVYPFSLQPLWLQDAREREAATPAAVGTTGHGLPHAPPLPLLSVQRPSSFSSSSQFFGEFFDGRNTRPCDLRSLAELQKQEEVQQRDPAANKLQQQHLHAALLAEIAAAEAARLQAKGTSATPEDQQAAKDAAAAADAAVKKLSGKRNEFLPRGLLLLAVEHPASDTLRRQSLSAPEEAVAAGDAARVAAEFGLNECSSPDLLQRVVRKVDAAATRAGSSAAATGIVGERHFCFFAVEPDIQTGHPLRSCGWTFDGGGAVLSSFSARQQEQHQQHLESVGMPRAFLLGVDISRLGYPDAPFPEGGFSDWAAASERQHQQQRRVEEWETAPSLQFSGWGAWLADISPCFRFLVSLFIPMRASVPGSTIASKSNSSKDGYSDAGIAPATAVAAIEGRIGLPKLVWVPHGGTWGHLIPLDISVSVRQSEDQQQGGFASNSPAPVALPGYSTPDFVWLAAWPSGGGKGHILNRVAVKKGDLLAGKARSVISTAASEANAEATTSDSRNMAEGAADAGTGSREGEDLSGLELLRKVLETPADASPQLQRLLAAATYHRTNMRQQRNEENDPLLSWLQRLLEVRDVEGSSMVLPLRLPPLSSAAAAPLPPPALPLRSPARRYRPYVLPSVGSIDDNPTGAAPTTAEKDTTPLALAEQQLREAQKVLDAAERRLAQKLETHLPLLLLDDSHSQTPAALYTAQDGSSNSNSSSPTVSFEFVLEARVNWLALCRTIVVEYFAPFVAGIATICQLLLGLVCLFIFFKFRVQEQQQQACQREELRQPQHQQQQQEQDVLAAPPSRVGCLQKLQYHSAIFSSCIRSTIRHRCAARLPAAALAAAASSVTQVSSYPFGVVWGNWAGCVTYLLVLFLNGFLCYYLQLELLQRLPICAALLISREPPTAFMPIPLPPLLQVPLLMLASFIVLTLLRIVLLLVVCQQNMRLPFSSLRRRAIGAAARGLRAWLSPLRQLPSRRFYEWLRCKNYSRNRRFIPLGRRPRPSVVAAEDMDTQAETGAASAEPEESSSSLVFLEHECPAEVPAAAAHSTFASEMPLGAVPAANPADDGSGGVDGAYSVLCHPSACSSSFSRQCARGLKSSTPTTIMPCPGAAADSGSVTLGSSSDVQERGRLGRAPQRRHAFLSTFAAVALLLAGSLFPYRLTVLLLLTSVVLLFIECSHSLVYVCPHCPRKGRGATSSKSSSTVNEQLNTCCALEWAMREAREGSAFAVYAQPFWLILMLSLCSGYAVIRSMNLHVFTEDGKSLIAGPDGTISHLLKDSRLVLPELMDAALPVLAVKAAAFFPSFLQPLLPSGLAERGSWGLTPTQDSFALLYFVCLLPACLFVAQRIGRIDAARRQHSQQKQHHEVRRQRSSRSCVSCSCSRSCRCSHHSPSKRSCSRRVPSSCLLRFGVCAAVQLTLASSFVALTGLVPIRSALLLAGSVLLQVLCCPL